MAAGREVYIYVRREQAAVLWASLQVCAVITRDSLLTIEMLNPAQWRMILWINQPLHTLPRAAAFNAAPAKCCLLSRYKYVRENGCKLHTNIHKYELTHTRARCADLAETAAACTLLIISRRLWRLIFDAIRPIAHQTRHSCVNYFGWIHSSQIIWYLNVCLMSREGCINQYFYLPQL